MRKGLLVAAAVALLVAGLVTDADAASTSIPCDATALVNAVDAANMTIGPSTLSLSRGCIYVLRAAALGVDGLPAILDTLTIHGNGATILRNSTDAFRILEVRPNITVALDHLTIEDGLLPTETTLGTTGQDGGGIENLGHLTLTSVTVAGNIAGTGASSPGASGANGGSGGGIFNGGTLNVVRSVVTSNTAGTGGTGFASVAASGDGGGIDNALGATATIVRSTITGNAAGVGGSSLASGGSGGNGGGISSVGTLTLTRTKVTSNRAGNGGVGTTQSGGNGGFGGGLAVITGSASVRSTTFAFNSAGNGGNGGVQGGLGAFGGGIVMGPPVRIVRSKIISNHAGVSGTGGTQSTASGGGIYNAGAPVRPVRTRIQHNTPNNCAPPGSVRHCKG